MSRHALELCIHMFCVRNATHSLPLPQAAQRSRSHHGARTTACLTFLLLALYVHTYIYTCVYQRILLWVSLLFYLDFKMFQSALQVRYNLRLFLAAWEYLGEYTYLFFFFWRGEEGVERTKCSDNGHFYNVNHCRQTPSTSVQDARWAIIKHF